MLHMQCIYIWLRNCSLLDAISHMRWLLDSGKRIKVIPGILNAETPDGT